MRRCNLPRWDDKRLLGLAESSRLSNEKEKICPQSETKPKTDTPTAAALESDLQKMLQERAKLNDFWSAPPAQQQDKDK